MCAVWNKSNRRSRLCLCLVVILLLICVSVEGYSNNHGAEVNVERHRQTESGRMLTLIDEAETLPPLFPFRWKDSLGYGVAILGLLLAAGSGVGGGGMLVPTYILLLQYPVKHAISLASTTVLGGAIANNLLNARKKHPSHSRRSVIDWELILQLEPMAILGALVGALLKDFLADFILIIMMLLLLTMTAYETLIKAYKLHQNEIEGNQTVTDGLGEKKPLLEFSSAHLAIDQIESQGYDENGPSRAAVKLSSLFALITTIKLLSGGPVESDGGPMRLDGCGTKCFWTTLVAMILVLLIFAIHQRRDLLSKISMGISVFSDIVWTAKNTIFYPCYALLAGLVAGLFGVGGGIILGPLMLALDVHPAVASATCACMVLFTSSTATVTYMAQGLLVPDYAAFCLLVGFASTILGQTVMSVLLQRYKRHSYIAFSIGIVVALSAVAMAIQSVVAIGSNH
jgi:uncharacterized membrane protein YfcA